MKKFVIFLMFLSTLFTLIIVFSNEKVELEYPEYHGENSIINVYSWLLEPKEVISIFERKYKNIKINWITIKDSYLKYVVQGLEKDNPIDVFQVSYLDLHHLVEQGLILNLSNQNIDTYISTKIDKELLEIVSRKEPVYAISGAPCYSCTKIIIGTKNMIYGIPFSIDSSENNPVTGSAFCISSKSDHVLESMIFSIWLCTSKISYKYFKKIGINLACFK